MQLTFNIRELREAVKGLGKVISRQSTLPVLHHLLVRVHDDSQVDLTATDLEQTLIFNAGEAVTDTTGAGAFLVPWDAFRNAVRECSAKSVLKIAVPGSDRVRLCIETDGITAISRELAVMAPDEFPMPPASLRAPYLDI